MTRKISIQAKDGFGILLDAFLQKRQNSLDVNSESQHLDEDVLNALIENSLTAREKLFYLKHLVNCALCRKSVAWQTESFVAFDQPSQPQSQDSRLQSLLTDLRNKLPLNLTEEAVLGYREMEEDKQLDEKNKEDDNS